MAASEKVEFIEHEGVVRNADHKSVTVIITPESACGGCHAKGSCNLSDREVKEIEVSGQFNFQPGDKVIVIMKKAMGYTAILLGYVFPAILIMIALIVTLSIHVNELTAGLVSIGILIPYYLILYLFRASVNSKFTFSIKS